MKGRPAPWGLLPIINRLKAIDLWNNPDYLDEMERNNDKVDEGKKRDFRNTVESFMKDYRPVFAKAFNGVNTSTLKKIDKRREQDGRLKSNP